MADNPYARWFRDSTPYISAHRGKTFVVYLGADALAHENLTNIVHDLALLKVLGVRLVLVHGARELIDGQLEGSRFHNHAGVTRRITSGDDMAAVINVCATARAQLEAAFSTGLPSSPLHNTNILLASGNLLVARPIGVLDGVDHQRTGRIRSVQVDALSAWLDSGAVVLLSPIGYSPSGEVYNLAAEEVAERVAVATRADKLIAFDQVPYLKDVDGARISNLSPAELDSMLDRMDAHTSGRASALLKAVRGGVPSGQLISFADDGALLGELFTADGVGTQIMEEDRRTIRSATSADVADIVELIRPLEEEGVLVRRERNVLEQEIGQFLVAELDGIVIGCCALYPAGEQAELACVAVHPSHRASNVGRRLLARAEARATELGFSGIFVLTTQARDWFVEQGFERADINDLPAPKQALYNYQRSSQVLTRTLKN